MPSRTATGIISGTLAAAIWGGMYVVSKWVLDVIPPFSLLSLRLLLGLAGLGAVAVWRRGGFGLTRHGGGFGLTRRQLLQVGGIGLVGYGISLSFQFVGTKLSTAANGAVITSATPAFVLLFARWILQEPISRRRLAALAVSTLGVMLIIDLRAAQLSPDLFWGNIMLIGAALTWALYSALVGAVTRALDVLPVTIVAFVGGLPVALLGAAWERQTTAWGTLTPGILLGVLYLGLVSTALAMFLWNRAFATLDAGVASLTFFAQPVVGAALGWLLLGETLTPLFLIGGGLIGAGLWLAARE